MSTWRAAASAACRRDGLIEGGDAAALRAAVPQGRQAGDRPDRQHPALSRRPPRAGAARRGGPALGASVAAHRRRSVVAIHDTHHPIAGCSITRSSARRQARYQRFLALRAAEIPGIFRARAGAEKRRPLPARPQAQLCRPVAVPDRRGTALRLPQADEAVRAQGAALVALHERVAKRPRIAAYLASERRIPFSQRASPAISGNSTRSVHGGRRLSTRFRIRGQPSGAGEGGQDAFRCLQLPSGLVASGRRSGR